VLDRHHFIRQFDGLYRAVRVTNPGHLAPQQKSAAPRGLKPRRQSLAERVTVRDFLVRRVDAADKPIARQRRLQPRAIGGGPYLLLQNIRDLAARMRE